MPNQSQNPQSLSTYGLPFSRSAAAGTSLVLLTGPGCWNSAFVVAGSTGGWLLVYDATSAPSDGAVTPVIALPVAAGGWVSINNGYPHTCVNGCTIVFSTTGPYTQTTSVANASFLAGQAAGQF